MSHRNHGNHRNFSLKILFGANKVSTFVLTGRRLGMCIVSAGRCPGLRKPLGFQPVVLCLCGHYISIHRAVPWAKETIGLSARCGCVVMTRAHILQTTPVARYCTIHNRSISLANSSPENDHILQRTVTMVVIHRTLLDAINHIQPFDDLAKHSITTIQMGHTTIFYIVLLHH